jgi:hypothetical protein
LSGKVPTLDGEVRVFLVWDVECRGRDWGLPQVEQVVAWHISLEFLPGFSSRWFERVVGKFWSGRRSNVN